ncbi:hypothetical protein JCM11641_007593 [Rhodosporidiobolus odoratus]
MPSTRSSSGALPFPASKSSSTVTKSKSSSKRAPPTGLDASIALFRSEVLSLLSAPPPVPAHIKVKPSDQVEVLCGFERISSHGIQQSVQVCRVVPGGSRTGSEGESWVTRMEGARNYFPRIARVQKRLRATDEDSDAEGEDGEDMDEDEAMATPSSSRTKKSRTSSSSKEKEKQRAAAPDAPRKSRRTTSRRHAHNDEDFDDGAETETEASHLARRHGGVRDAPPLASSSHSRRSTVSGSPSAELRRSRRHQSREEPLHHVKQEDVDDLASLCGRVDNLGVRGTVEPGAPPL